MKRYIELFCIVALALSSCYKEDDIHAEPGTPKYTIEDSNDPLDHARYEFMKNTGVYILYDFTNTDYWTLTENVECIWTLQADRSVLTTAVCDYLPKVLFDYYDNAFKKQFFPLKILLAERIEEDSWFDPEVYGYLCGRSFMAVGNITAETVNGSEEALRNARGELNGALWGDFLYGNKRITIPESFFKMATQPYNKYLGREADDIDIYELGYWRFDQSYLPSSKRTPANSSADVHDFVLMMTTHTEAELNDMMEGYDILRRKYDLLRKAIIEQTGVDIQKIGDIR